MNIRNTIKKSLKEAVGVVPHIHETAEKIYRSLANALSNDSWSLNKWQNEEEKEFHFSGDFRMGDTIFSDAKVLVRVEESDTEEPIETNKMAVALEVERLPDLSLEQGIGDDTLNIIIVFDINFDSEDVIQSSGRFGDFMSDFMQSEKPTIISSLSHEIKHAYDATKSKKMQPISRAYYKGVQNIGVGPIKPLQKLLFGLYFIHFVENSVRPNEIHSLLVSNNITPKQFYDFITNQRVYKIFAEYRDLTYENFYNNLKTNYMEEIDGFFQHIGFLQYKRMDDDQKVEKLLDVISTGLRNSTIQELEQLIFDSEGEMKLAQLGLGARNKILYMIKNSGVVNRRFSDDGEKTFRNEIKDMNRISDKMVKKISKLYSLVNNQEPELSKVEKYKRHKK